MANYFEVKNVSQSSEIKKAFEEAVKINAPKYRAISKTNQYYGWDETADKFVKASIGQEWFDNPYFKAEEPKTDEIDDNIEDEDTENTQIPEKEIETEETDYKALYVKKCEELNDLLEAYTGLETGYESVNEQNKIIKQENEELKNGILALKTLFNKVQ